MKCDGVLFCILPLTFIINTNSKGLNEEFTWSRIGFVWPREARYGYYGRPNAGFNPTGDFAFPQTSTEDQIIPEGGGPSREEYVYGKCLK